MCDLAGGAHQLDGGLFVTALGKLEKEFKRLLHEHSHPIDLPDNMESQEGGTPTSSSELDYSFSYPPDVLEKLQGIIGKLVGHPNYQRCIDAYQETRRALCDESMQVSSTSHASSPRMSWSNSCAQYLQDVYHFY